MAPAVIEQQAASSAQNLIVPLMMALVVLAVLSQAPQAAPIAAPIIEKPGPAS